MEYTLTFTEDDLRIINSGLQEIPMKFAAPLVMKINKQITEQAIPEDSNPE